VIQYGAMRGLSTAVCIAPEPSLDLTSIALNIADSCVIASTGWPIADLSYVLVARQYFEETLAARLADRQITAAPATAGVPKAAWENAPINALGSVVIAPTAEGSSL